MIPDPRTLCKYLAEDYTRELFIDLPACDIERFQGMMHAFREEIRRACEQMPQEEGLSIYQSALAGFSFLSTFGRREGILCKPTLHCNDPSPAEKAQAAHNKWMGRKA